jgi:hypothetical protein
VRANEISEQETGSKTAGFRLIARVFRACAVRKPCLFILNGNIYLS